MIGICIGSLHTSISYYSKSETFSILLSETSNRQFKSIVSFPDDERKIGDASFFELNSNIDCSLLSGIRYFSKESNELNKEKILFPSSLKIGEKNEGSLFSKREKKELTVTQIMTSYISKLVEYINKNLNRKDLYNNKSSTDSDDNRKENIITLSIPDYFTYHERLSYQNSILLLEKVYTNTKFHIINESTAITLSYFNKKKQFQHEKIICFIDIGHSKTSIIYSSYKSNQSKVLHVKTNRSVGSRDFDWKIVNFIINQVNDKLEIGNKLLLRLLENVSKAKKSLSVTESTMIIVDSMYNNIDFSIELSRNLFYQLINEYIDIIKNDISSSIRELFTIYPSLSITSIQSIELIGDGMRLPIFDNIIFSIFGKGLSKSLSSDEVISNGCALYSYFTLLRFNSIPIRLCQICSFNVYLKTTILKEGCYSSNDLVEISYMFCTKNKAFPLTEKVILSNLSEVMEILFYSDEDVLLSKYELYISYKKSRSHSEFR